MNDPEVASEKDKKRAQKCLECGVCGYARKKQSGILLWLLKLENRICPYARAYRRVYGRESHEPIPEDQE